jgi:hypothetical protein
MLQKEQTQPPGGIAVLVTQEVSVEQEDPWTGAPQDTLDGQNENYDTASQSEGWQAQQGV